MAFADYGSGTNVEGPANTDRSVLSLRTDLTRKGYAICASDAADSLARRAAQIVVCGVVAATGMGLMWNAASMVSRGSVGAWLLPAIGAYLSVTALVWLIRLLRGRAELRVDKGARALHLLRRGFAGAERGRQTIRFEEIAKITLVDGLPSRDMQAHARNWSMARIDVTWQGGKCRTVITGDVDELEPLAAKLRREVGLE